MLRFLTHRRAQIVLLMMLLGAALFLQREEPSWIERLRQITFDQYNRMMPRHVEGDVVIIDIDEKSLKEYGQWPWPRTTVAQLLGELHALGPKSVAFDIVFAEKDRTSPQSFINRLPHSADMDNCTAQLQKLPDNDSVFAQMIVEAGNVVTGFCGANQKTDQSPLLKASVMETGDAPDAKKFIQSVSNFSVTLPELMEKAAGNGSFSEAPEGDGVIRRVPLFIGQIDAAGYRLGMYPSLALEALRVALGRSVYQIESYGQNTTHGHGIQSISIGDYHIPTDQKGRMWLYDAGYHPELYIPAWKILDHKINSGIIKDKIIFVGTSTIGLWDLRSSPLASVIPGVEIHAQIIEQILHGKFLKRSDASSNIELIITGLICACIIFLAPFIGAGTLAFIATLLIGSGVVGALYAYQQSGLLIDPVYPSLTVIIIFILSSILTNLRTEMERRTVKTAFGHYISPTLMEELAKNPDKLKLGGEVREISVMFTDIRNFTSISETMDPAELIKMMNDFLTPMTSCVLDNRGTIDKYMGDAMMAFWNAPLDDPEHAVHACTAALQMLAALKVVNVGLQEQAEKNQKPFKELKAGIGIHTGRASVGNMGSKQRFAYSALGDTVNLASRLEGQTKGYGISVMISEEVRKQAPSFAALEIDLLTVKGRKEPERIYTLLGDADFAGSPAFQELASVHGRMLAAYRAQKWDEALALAGDCETLRPELAGLYALYRQRIADFKTTPPPAGWQGVWVAKDKS